MLDSSNLIQLTKAGPEQRMQRDFIRDTYIAKRLTEEKKRVINPAEGRGRRYVNFLPNNLVIVVL